MRRSILALSGLALAATAAAAQTTPAFARAPGAAVPTNTANAITAITVRGAAQTTEVGFRLPDGARFRESIDAPGRAIVLEIRGGRVLAALQRPVNAGGIVAFAVQPQGDTAARIAIKLADLRAYAVKTLASGEVRLSIDGNGEEFPQRTISLVPEERSVAVPRPSPAPTAVPSVAPQGTPVSPAVNAARSQGGQELIDNQAITADERTQKTFASWERAASAQAPMQSIHWNRTLLRDALATISRYSGRSVVPGVGTDTILVNGDFQEARWTDVLRSLARVNGLRIRVSEGDIITLEQVQSVAQQQKALPLETRVFRVSYIKADKAEGMLKEHLSERGKITAIEERGAVMVTDVPEHIERVAQILRILDSPDRQIRVSAMVISIDKSVARDLGITYDVAKTGLSLGGIPRPGTTTGTGTGTSGTTKEIEDSPLNQWNLGRKGVGGAGTMGGPAPISPALKAVLQTVAGNYSILTLVQALEANRMAKIVARQTGVVREGETFKGNSGERTPLRTIGYLGQGGVQGQVGQQPQQNTSIGSSGNQQGGGGYPTATVGLQETGTKLEVTPRIEPDDMVALDVRVERSTAVASGIGDAGVQFLVNEYSTRLRARNGATTVIGGLEDRVTGNTESGVPVLMHLPLIGRAFKSTSRSSSERVLVILVSAQVEE